MKSKKKNDLKETEKVVKKLPSSAFAKGNQLAKGLYKIREYAKAVKLIAEGMTVTEAVKEAGLHINSFYNIKNSDPRLAKVYYEVLKRRSDLDFENIRKEIMNCDKDTAFAAKIKLEFLRWEAAKLNPEIFADKPERPPVSLEINIGGEVIKINDKGKSKWK